MLSFFTASFHTLCVGTKTIFPWVFLLILSSSLSAQSLQKLYSNLDNPTSVYATQNAIYVVEQGKNRLLKLDHSGKLLETIGGKGSGDYQFSRPVDVDATNGLKVFVTDFNNRRVQVFDRRGQYLSSIEGRNSFGETRQYNPTQVAVDQMGEVYFADSETRYIYHFDLDYNLLDEFRLPAEIESVDDLLIHSAELLILDKATETIHRLSLNGTYQGFYPAEGVKTIFSNERGLWKVFDGAVELESLSGSPQKIQFGGSQKVKAVAIQGEMVFLLTGSELFKLNLPES